MVSCSYDHSCAYIPVVGRSALSLGGSQRQQKRNARNAQARRKAQDELSRDHRRKMVMARFHKMNMKVNKALKKELRKKGLAEAAEGGAG